ncbi:chromosome partitioning protein ParA [Halarchaeum grantii]|uniref:Chromosome partitioning protein ParA n=1 Tax=Halarchaeum grantii TaxID=1193105 RepID=A0A830FC23_9EURY|nr:ParA family protein [Halarchaeum grantii]GGL38983.1 chromosome partitioning protein ParA [Halarchaeum grantii]
MPTTAYTIWSEAGGVGKTTFTVTLAAAHARHGQRVLVVDLDPQDGGATHHFGATDERSNPEADNLVRHMIGRPKGDFADLVEGVADGIDLVPSHNMLESLERNLLRAQRMEEDMGEEFVPERQLRRVLSENAIPETYDVIIIDPPATGGQHVYNAVYAASNLLIPIELSAKGQESVEGMRDTVEGIEAELEDVEVGVLGVVPNRVSNTKTQSAYKEALEEQGFPVAPVEVRERRAMLEGAWDAQTTPYEFATGRERVRERELETLRQFDELARYVAAQFGVELDESDIDEEVRL